MAVLRVCLTFLLTLLLRLDGAGAADPQPAAPPGLFDRPVLVVDPGMHTAPIRSASADKDGNWAVTGSWDKTIRVWSLADGVLVRTIRLPAGPGNVGKAVAVAISPDGALVAAGGFTGLVGQPKAVYLFDRATGALLRRIESLPDVVNHLAFSPDGARLAALLGKAGFRVYAKQTGWAEAARDEDYAGPSYGADFASDGRLATTSFDGKIRVYTGDLRGTLRPSRFVQVSGGHLPYGIAFSPDGAQLAIGYENVARVDRLDAGTLALLPRPDLHGIDNGNLHVVAWSRDGMTLFAAGRFRDTVDSYPVLAWAGGGAGARRMLMAGADTVMSPVPLPGGDLLVASTDPWLGRLALDGTSRWRHGPAAADLRNERNRFSVSADGGRIGFYFDPLGNSPAHFDLTKRVLTAGSGLDAGMKVPRQTGLPVENWQNQFNPTLGGKRLPLHPYETSRSLAVHPKGDRFVLGADWSLRAFDAQGKPLWTRAAPGAIWAVNITGDGRLVVAACGDGTIRWHRMSDGAELLAFMPLADRTNWVAWTPQGFYAATAGAQGVLRWHVNRGWDAAADSVAIADIPGSYRPAVLPLVLQELETPRALGLAEMAEHNREVMLRTNSQVPPGSRLHLLAIGISAYNQEYAKNLRLHYADRDANDLASAIVNTQSSLYQVEPQVLLDKDANRIGIMEALEAMRRHMAAGDGNDLAVVHFSGHGAMVDGKLYLLPYEVDARDDPSIKASGLEAGAFRDELLELAKYGRVLVLLDACHSGATTMDGAAIAIDADALRTGLAAANVTVLTSSKGSETSEERDTWQHGAFTKALLDAFNDPAADINHNGLISTTGLESYLMKARAGADGRAPDPGDRGPVRHDAVREWIVARSAPPARVFTMGRDYCGHRLLAVRWRRARTSADDGRRRPPASNEAPTPRRSPQRGHPPAYRPANTRAVPTPITPKHRGTPARPIRRRVRPNPVMIRPTKVRMFMPKRMSLVSIPWRPPPRLLARDHIRQNVKTALSSRLAPAKVFRPLF
jgi:WD40 repeat protein